MKLFGSEYSKVCTYPFYSEIVGNEVATIVYKKLLNCMSCKFGATQFEKYLKGGVEMITQYSILKRVYSISFILKILREQDISRSY